MCDFFISLQYELVRETKSALSSVKMRSAASQKLFYSKQDGKSENIQPYDQSSNLPESNTGGAFSFYRAGCNLAGIHLVVLSNSGTHWFSERCNGGSIADWLLRSRHKKINIREQVRRVVSPWPDQSEQVHDFFVRF